MKELSFKVKKIIAKRRLKQERLSLLLDEKSIAAKIDRIDKKLEELDKYEEPEPEPEKSRCLV